MTPQREPMTIRITSHPRDADAPILFELEHSTLRGGLVPRESLDDVQFTEPFDKAGVYVMMDSRSDGIPPEIYVGVSDNLPNRVSEHFSSSQDWTHALVSISDNPRMHRLCFEAVEARLIEMAFTCSRHKVRNAQQPKAPNLPPDDVALTKEFVAQALFCLPFFGIDLSRDPGSPQGPVSVPFLSGDSPDEGQDDNQSPEALLRFISDALGIEITKIRLLPSLPSKWLFHTTNTYFRVKDLQSQAQFREACGAATRHQVPRMNRRQWDAVVDAIFKVREP